MSETQSLKNHARLDPAYHVLLLALYVLNLVYAGFHVYRQPSLSSGWYVVLSVLAIVPLLKIRTYPLKVQDRVIRLEERIRLQALAPQELHSQLYRLTEDQLIALRFASDGEVVELAKQAVEQNLNRKQIKERIRSWRADDWRV
jgi:cell division protein FtsL